jgi:hypothetical protein
MQGQMHVHAPDLPDTVVIPGYFFPRAVSELSGRLLISVIE